MCPYVFGCVDGDICVKWTVGRFVWRWQLASIRGGRNRSGYKWLIIDFPAAISPAGYGQRSGGRLTLIKHIVGLLSLYILLPSIMGKVFIFSFFDLCFFPWGLRVGGGVLCANARSGAISYGCLRRDQSL